METIYNPFLGDIPQPELNTQEVKNSLIPKTNYGANTVIPLITLPFIQLLETNNTENVQVLTTSPAILTAILINRKLYRSAGGSTATHDVFINGVKIISFNDQIADGGEVNNDFYIPIQNWLIESNTTLRLESVRGGTGGSSTFNISFIGYIPTNK